jgi:hypothetical protein
LIGDKNIKITGISWHTMKSQSIGANDYVINLVFVE